MRTIVAAVSAVALATAIVAAATRPPAPAPRRAPRVPQSLRIRVLRSFPHDPGAFTQGLLFHAGKLYESTGLLGRSSLRRLDLATGAVEAKVALDRALFGEGLAEDGGRLVQLTWTSGRALLWSLDGFRPAGEWTYAGEGWGLCSDGRRFIMSDGSDVLTFRDRRTFAAEGTLPVRDDAGPVVRLNELECVGDAVYANVWQTSRIARIDVRTGDVTAWIEAGGLLGEAQARGADVLNGIAALPSPGRFVVTGKLWPLAFEVEFVAAP